MKSYGLLMWYKSKHQIKSLILILALIACLSFLFQAIFMNNANLTAVPIALVDEDQSASSKQVVSGILSKSVLNTSTMNFDTATEALNNHRVEAIVRIKTGFQKALVVGQYTELIDLIYLDRSTAAPALTDVLAGAVLREATVYNAISLVKRYDTSDAAAYEIEKKVRDSIAIQEYSLSIETAIQTPSLTDQKVAKIPFETQLPLRLTLGYVVFIAFLHAALQAAALSKELNSPAFQRLLVAGYPPMVYTITSVLLPAIGFSLLYGAILILFFYISGITSQTLLFMPVHLSLALALWFLMILTIALLFKGKASLYTFLLPIVVTTGLISGCFWPLDFINQSLLKPLSFLPSISIIRQLETYMIGQNPPVMPIQLLFILLFLGLVAVTIRVTILKGQR